MNKCMWDAQFFSSPCVGTKFGPFPRQVAGKIFQGYGEGCFKFIMKLSTVIIDCGMSEKIPARV